MGDNTPDKLLYSLAEVASHSPPVIEMFLKECKSIGDDREHTRNKIAEFLRFVELKVLEAGSPERGKVDPVISANTDGTKLSLARMNSSSNISFVGRILERPSRPTLMGGMKIVPVQDEKSMAASCLNTSDAVAFIEDFNADLEFENEKVIQMDNIIQT